METSSLPSSLTTSRQIVLFQLLSLRGRLQLEIRGMTCRGPSAYSLVKKRFGFHGNKQAVLRQLEKEIENFKEYLDGTAEKS